MWTIASVLMVAAFMALVSARRRLGWQLLRFEGSTIELKEADARIDVALVSHWAFDRGVAKLYGGAHTWLLAAKAGEEEALRNSLTRVLGAPRGVQRRGSLRVRLGAAVILLASVGSALVAFQIHSVPLAMTAGVATVLSLGCLLAFSQRVTQSNSDEQPMRPPV